MTKGEMMEEKDLEDIEQHMRNRDHHQMHTQPFNHNTLLVLADKVPDLVAEVRRLNLQNGELLAALVALADRVSVRFGETIKYEPVATGRYLDAAYEAITKAKVAVAQKLKDDPTFFALCAGCGCRMKGVARQDCRGCPCHGQVIEKPKHDHGNSPCPRCGTVQPDVEKRIDEPKPQPWNTLKVTANGMTVCISCGTERLQGTMCPKCFGPRT